MNVCVYSLHTAKVHLSEGFFAFFIIFFGWLVCLIYCEKQWEQPCGGTEDVRLLGLVLPLSATAN